MAFLILLVVHVAIVQDAEVEAEAPVSGGIPEVVASIGEHQASAHSEEQFLRSQPKGYLLSRATFAQGDGVRPTNPLGSGMGHSLWLRLLDLKGVDFALSLDKDQWEPLFPIKGSRFSLWEASQWSAVREGHRGLVILGSFRVSHGFHLASGSRSLRRHSASSPTSQPRSLLQIRPYTGTASFPVRRGIVAVLGGNPKISGWFSSRHHNLKSSGDVVNPVSTSSLFRSDASVDNRRRIKVGTMGTVVAGSWKSFDLSVLAESYRKQSQRIAASLDSGTGPIEHIGRWQLAVASSVDLGQTRSVTEVSRQSDGSRSHRLSLLWRPTKNSGARLDHAGGHGNSHSPYANGSPNQSGPGAWRMIDLGLRLSTGGGLRLSFGRVVLRKASHESGAVEYGHHAYLSASWDTGSNAVLHWTRRWAADRKAHTHLIRSTQQQAIRMDWSFNHMVRYRLGWASSCRLCAETGSRGGSGAQFAIFVSRARMEAGLQHVQVVAGEDSSRMYFSKPATRASLPVLSSSISSRWITAWVLRRFARGPDIELSIDRKTLMEDGANSMRMAVQARFEF